MTSMTIKAAVAALLISMAGAVVAGDDEAKAPVEKSAVEQQKLKQEQTKIEARRKANAKIKPVDINGANKKQLMKLPGISEAYADKIIAGRPYGSKAWLVTKDIIPQGTFEGVKLLIIAKQPYADGTKNAALYMNKK